MALCKEKLVAEIKRTCQSLEGKNKVLNYLNRNPKNSCRETGIQVQIGKPVAASVLKECKRLCNFFSLLCKGPLKKKKNW